METTYIEAGERQKKLEQTLDHKLNETQSTGNLLPTSE